MDRVDGLIAVAPPPTRFVYFFQAGAPFSIENDKFYPVLAIFGHFVTNLRTLGVPFIGLNSVVVAKN